MIHIGNEMKDNTIISNYEEWIASSDTEALEKAYAEQNNNESNYCIPDMVADLKAKYNYK